MTNDGDPTRAPQSGVTPYLSVVGGKAAVEFYKRAFLAEETFRNTADDGERILHSRLIINGDWVMLSDHFAEMAGGAAFVPPASVTLHLQVDDADTWWNRAIEAGATVRFPLADQFWGDRYGQLVDPFGHSWSIASKIKA
ncbi:glyoxalase [Caulobacter sp. Root655]|uniref:VOC family protein n=1 Tax=Caulobacter sp. Root655 TaxID=1736578 RepID=UPI0006FF0861|nr:VOC family protein [Caulobacter sp. Root655]KRA58594.1 glyoxalase [Caulobacter sp. Root655]